MNELFFFGSRVPSGAYTVSSEKWSELPALFFSASFGNNKVFLSIDVHPASLRRAKRLSGHFKVAVLVEPVSVNSYQYKAEVLRHFDLVFYCQSRPGVDFKVHELTGGQVTPAHHREFYSTDFSSRSIAKRAACIAMVASNKFSGHPSSTYHLRRTLANFLQQNGYEVSVAGRLWSRSRGSDYFSQLIEVARSFFSTGQLVWRVSDTKRGMFVAKAVRNKFAHFRECSLALVVENEPTGVSEKLFDALVSGCRVIYVGPRLDEGTYPKCFVYQVPGDDPYLTLKAVEYLRHCSIRDSQIEFFEWVRDLVGNPDLQSRDRIRRLLTEISHVGAHDV
jgi:hypothetical protein